MCHLPANFLVAKSLRPGAHSVGVTIELYGHKTAWVVRADGAQNNEGLTLLYLAKTESVIHADRGGSNVKRVHGSARNPVLLNFDKLFKALEHFFR